MEALSLDFEPVTARIDGHTHVDDFRQLEDQQQACVVTGLHTCGDLHEAVLALFVKEPKITGMCVVGCCYHLITEHGGDDEKEEDEATAAGDKGE